MMKKLLFLSVLFFYVEIKCLFDVQKGEYLKIFKIHVFETRGLISSIHYSIINNYSSFFTDFWDMKLFLGYLM